MKYDKIKRNNRLSLIFKMRCAYYLIRRTLIIINNKLRLFLVYIFHKRHK